MDLDTSGKRNRRKAMLRAIYEENRRIPTTSGTDDSEERRSLLQGVYESNVRLRAKRQAPKPWRLRRWQAGAALLGVLLLVTIAGFVIWGGPQAEGSDPFQSRTAGLLGARPLVLTDSATLAYGRVAQTTPRELTLANVYGLEVRTIVLDAGHGGRDPGAVGAGGLFEKDVTLDIVHRLRARLETHGYRILLTRHDDTAHSLRARASFANAHNADLFVSVHVNALPRNDLSVVETFYFGAEVTDQATLQLAERENREAGYSLADFKEMAQKLGSTMKLEESERLAESIQTSLYRNIRPENPDLVDWGVREAPFAVLLGVDAPGVLAEIACISNSREEELLMDPVHRDRLAAALEEGIVRYLDQRALPGVPSALPALDANTP
ncbi:MAG: N-acetylmuramoyl-L-alanine amidase [Bacteroidota bacterium]